MGFENASPRDACRRTFKTMGQIAGITIELLDLIQNHVTVRSVSSTNYNRYNLTNNGRQKMNEVLAKWESFLQCL